MHNVVVVYESRCPSIEAHSSGASAGASASVRASSEKLHVEEDLDINIPGLQLLLPPHKNPFASEKMTFDPNEHPDAQKVTTNEYVYAFRGL